MGKPKNLNKESNRQFLLDQRRIIDEKLSEERELYIEDFERYLELYHKALVNAEFAEKSRDKYYRNAKWFVETYTKDDDPLEKQDVIKFKEDLQKKYTKVSTINNYITTINRFLHFCDLGNLTVAKTKQQTVNVLDDRLYDHEVVRLRNRAKKVNMQMYFIIRIMSEMGLRVAEREFITVENIKTRKLSVEVNNKGKWRTVPMPQELARDLRKYAKEKKIESGPILSLSYDDIYAGLKRIAGCCKINKSKVHPHALRHYFGFRFVQVNGNASITQLADIMGHESIQTTQIYTRGTSQDYRKAIEKMV
ncbi:hypothetical protein AOC36_09670 [Erysipelothrix larvae]|uniref:Tyr recombinase domain-containing protein n=1 Tax=Erysipelothrix larvae TaxID=1514105 RepID=A0A0X8H1A7_9FIRM|nr:site-specific integrase [Erysipelothrix larvae]AMC94241.1 hypothetical protein AOC36_09670 [Erysipelothrix larvae]